MMGADQPTHYRFKLGGFEVTSIWDGAVTLDGPHPIFGQNQPAEAVQELAKENFLPPEKMAISFTPVIVNTGSEIVMFDSGNGARRRPAAGRIASTLSQAGFSADQIDTVVITHCHGDHIGLVIVGGLLVGTFFTLFVIPVVLTYLAPKSAAKGEAEEEPSLKKAA